MVNASQLIFKKQIISQIAKQNCLVQHWRIPLLLLLLPLPRSDHDFLSTFEMWSPLT